MFDLYINPERKKYMNKGTVPKQTSQLNSTKIPNLLALFAEKTTTDRSILAAAFTLDNTCNDVYPSQTNLAVKAGCRRETANRKIKEFEQEDIIRTRQYRYFDTLNYYINPLFHDREVRKELSIFPEFKKCFSVATIWWLISPSPIYSKNNKLAKEYYVTLTNNVCSIMNKQQLNSTVSRADAAAIQREKLIAQLTPQQKEELDTLRKGYSREFIPSGGLWTTSAACKNWQPQTVGDLFKKIGEA